MNTLIATWDGCSMNSNDADLWRTPWSSSHCLENLAAVATHRDRLGAMRNRLFALIGAQRDPSVFGSAKVFDEYRPAMPVWAAFNERWLRGEASVPEWVNVSDFEIISSHG